ncbi:AarF/ABC1/UbiB kinase family protein [Porphyrobacter sp. GA68]|uniref:ABC1 kinase family protein n=1 Tax=Porphyrobacter sp. GA68 TaxID=2883480 RepID=UPI001D17F8A5|nr:AarF/ABC1/UbiB kinase family protein [Porphyrobacter sp. GA68]
MADDDDRPARHRAVPAGRLSRLSSFGKLAGGVAGSVLTGGAQQLARGQRPSMNQLLLTPANATRLTEQLSQLRGAAMKMGQMLSLDAGDLLPPELADILATLRDRANFMPPAQLDRVLREEWGADWRKGFRRFDPRPLAAASIGQVHRAQTLDGRDLAIKVQYPGIARSIDSDVDNIATLLHVSGLLPKELDVAPLLAAAKEQLHEEADYLREGRMMERYGALLDDDARFIVPKLDAEHTRSRVLAMAFIEGDPIEALASEPQAFRDEVFSHLIELVARELFVFGLMQTDPNFANYRFQRATGRIVLLDFGAARPVAANIAGVYRKLVEAGLARDNARVRREVIAAGFINESAAERHRTAFDQIIEIVVTEMNRPGPLDFGDRSFVPQIRELAMPMAQDRQSWHLPPVETLFVQRKVSGTALLGARLKARVDVRAVLTRALRESERQSAFG